MVTLQLTQMGLLSEWLFKQFAFMTLYNRNRNRNWKKLVSERISQFLSTPFTFKKESSNFLTSASKHSFQPKDIFRSKKASLSLLNTAFSQGTVLKITILKSKLQLFLIMKSRDNLIRWPLWVNACYVAWEGRKGSKTCVDNKNFG